MNIVEKAREIALKAHEGQTRWDPNVPYFTHPERVANAVRCMTMDNWPVAAAQRPDELSVAVPSGPPH